MMIPLILGLSSLRMFQVFTSCYRDSIFIFLKKNDFIESEIQNDFTPKVSRV